MQPKRLLIVIALAAVAIHFANSQKAGHVGGAGKPVVLAVYDIAAKAKLPKEERALVDSVDFRTWLTAHCAAGASSPAWRIAPSGTDFSHDDPPFSKLMAEPRKSNNWLYVAEGDRIEQSVPLPASEAAAMKLIGKYAK
jgi:hypothetical protein